MAKRISPEMEKELHKLRSLGWGYRHIAKALGISISCVQDHINPHIRERRNNACKARYFKNKLDPEKVKRFSEYRHERYLKKKIRDILGDDYDQKRSNSK
ncbi:hypothetical protein EVC27_067 [Rhizobium phage RHph_I1_6]|uniref:Uncharacterized protein n=1 Tax=Rhizobium phage RHph_I1_6 TaxID=2509728 RepID=A0A7S5RFL4_9CAUD|nr:hypothetical protein PP745_gp067 [Rhizobium phage RHph_I1_6]QIG76592.1 hypothetical protein EVC27_067 [Rhizobium phage RHph_I1_6]